MRHTLNIQQSILRSIPILAATLSVVWACGPWFPDWLLTQGETELLKPPTTHFQNEIQQLASNVSSPYVTVSPATSKPQQTADKAIEDLREALIAQSLPPQTIEAVLSQHQASREAVRQYREDIERYDALQSSPWLQEDMNVPSFSPPALSDKLPLEFSLYFKGAVAYHRKQFQAARTFWQEVLALPEKDRPYRSTWAAFMLGRLDVDPHPEQAIPRFQLVRKLVDQGYQDRLGLGAASLGWEARSWFHLNQYRKAVELYLEQMATGDPQSAQISIRWVLARALKDRPDGLKDLASSPGTRRMTTAYLASMHSPGWQWDDQEDLERVNAWVDAIEQAQVPEETLFEPLALTVYQRGFYELCERLLVKAPQNGMLATWLKSKLLFRKGDIEQATTLLAQIATQFPVQDDPIGSNRDHPSTSKQGSPEQPLTVHTALDTWGHRPKGEWGILLLHRGDYIQSMDILLRAGFWMDAAYIAERVLTLEELKTYVDQSWTAKKQTATEEDLNPEFPPSAWSAWAPEDDKRYQIRYLLARRLAREDRNDEASPYYPEQWRKIHQQRIQQLKTGYDATQAKAIRSTALWEAAKTTRYTGLELIGTELGPDWAIHDGNFEVGVTLEARQNQDGTLLKPSPDELERADHTRLEPYARWHYRLLAADIAWDALTLMPDDDETTARRFCEAGAWIKGRNPKAADRFYKTLVNRCGKTAIGRAAKATRWFPNLDQDGNIIIKKKDDIQLPQEDIPITTTIL